MNLSSVIVFQIDVDGIALDPTECNAPVSACAHRVTALIAADERMKAEAWQIHVLRPRRVIKRAQNVGDSSRILHAEPAPVCRNEEAFIRFCDIDHSCPDDHAAVVASVQADLKKLLKRRNSRGCAIQVGDLDRHLKRRKKKR